MMRRLLTLLTLCAVLAVAGVAQAQFVPTLGVPESFPLQISTSSATSNGNLGNLNGRYAVVGISANGTFNGATFTIQLSNDNSSWSNANCYTLDGGTNVNTAGWLTAAGNWRCNSSGFLYIRAAINSGTPTSVSITAQGSPNGAVRDTTNQLQTSQIRTNQSVAPTCSFGCGTSPSVVGSDSAMKVTMGTSPTDSSIAPFEIFFNATWAAAPACTVSNATVATGTAANYVTRVITTATEVRVNTAAGPSSADVYSVVCLGVQ